MPKGTVDRFHAACISPHPRPPTLIKIQSNDERRAQAPDLAQQAVNEEKRQKLADRFHGMRVVHCPSFISRELLHTYVLNVLLSTFTFLCLIRVRQQK